MDRITYPRTYHLPWSPGATSDDKKLKSTSHFEGRRVIVTEKRDGENTTLYGDGYVHARSVDGTGKAYQTHIIREWRNVCWSVEPSFRVCGENLYARHSIGYDNLLSYFEVFSIWRQNTSVSWTDLVTYTYALGMRHVPVLYDGVWDEKAIRDLEKTLDTEKVEGYVVRLADEFEYDEFAMSVAKWVRPNHVQTDEHWTKNWVPNGLAK